MSSFQPEIIEAQEHGKIKEEEIKDYLPYLKNLTKTNYPDANSEEEQKNNLKEIHYLGLNQQNQHFQFSYYIGVDWLITPQELQKIKIEKSLEEKGTKQNPSSDGTKENSLPKNPAAFLVTPKIENLDYLKMFTCCIAQPYLTSYIKSCYFIFTNKPSILLKEKEKIEITPLLLFHYFSLLKMIVARGLKRGYQRKTENLYSKIKGKMLLSKNITHNLCQGRKDRNFCCYQDYTLDCKENQILKKALLYCQNYFLSPSNREKFKELHRDFHPCISAFDKVSDITINQIRQYKINPLYKEYKEALRLALQILKRFDYSIQNTSKENIDYKVPPFWIDMSKLFEMYTYTLLYSAYRKKIFYQVKGKYGEVDFIKKDEKIVIDTKYKKIYQEKEQKEQYNIFDIRQLAGYARDTSILEKLGKLVIKERKTFLVDNTLAPCLILYPDTEGTNEFPKEKLLESKKTKTIEQFLLFYKHPVSLPTITK